MAIILALQGHNVDVMTSSRVLAERDAESHKDIFDLFGVTVGHNCTSDFEQSQRVYKRVVVFGEIGTFQRDTLLDSFHGKNVGIGSRERGYIIVDEVDSMLLDKGENVLYLSHGLPEMDALEGVYVYIWAFVNVKDARGTDADVRMVMECVRSTLGTRYSDKTCKL